MKKIFTFLLLALSAFTLKSTAQNTSCSAAFSFTVTGLSVQFAPAITADTSTNHNYWRFGDGGTSSVISPSHVYSAPGVYNVTHIFYRSVSGALDCIDSVTHQVAFTSAPPACTIHSSFIYRRDSIQTNKVYFTNTSTPANDILHVQWNFGDGTSSTDYNATHVFATSGLYNVCLIVRRDSACVNYTCTQIQVQTPPPACNLVANFTSYTDSSQINKIHFINLSTPFASGDTIRWNFGDGSAVSYDLNPTHVYTTPGTYNVCIRVAKHASAAGTPSCVKEICKTVVVQSQCNLQAYFSYHADSVNHNKIYFTNQSTPATAVLHVLWTFGDGTSSDQMNPYHIYSQPGSYTVCLKIYGSGSTCTREFCKTVEVVGIPCADISKFNFNRVSTNDCLTYKFEPVNKDTTWHYHWTFGDGASSNDMMPVHSYYHSGTYHACLTVTRGTSCTSVTCKDVVTGTCFSCNSVWARYEYFRESTMSNRIYFHALSNYPIISQTWTITRIYNPSLAPVVINQNNPIYTFNDTGYYRVCLRAVTYGQCIKEYCEIIKIGQPEGVCTLSAYPNPTHVQVTFNVQLQSPEMIHVYIYNAMNVLVKQNDKQGATGVNVVTTNIESLIPGLYNVRIVYGNHICYSRFQKY